MFKKRRFFIFLSIFISLFPYASVKTNFNIVKKNGWILSQTDININ